MIHIKTGAFLIEMQKRRKYHLLLILGILIVVVVMGIFVARPRHMALSEAIIEEKQQYGEQYLTFVEENLISGGVGKDDIPAIDEPQYITARQADIAADEVVFGISYQGFVAAYPQDILYWHEIVNEEIDGEKIALTYCPLTGSAIGYRGKELGVSGKLYNSNLVFYDRETDSLYPQILGVAVSGEERGDALSTIPVTVTSWAQWSEKYPDTLVLSEQTGFQRDYDRSPYPGYDESLRIWFPLSDRSERFHSKEIIYGIVADGEAFAITAEKMHEAGVVDLKTRTGDVQVHYDDDLDEIRVMGPQGVQIKHFKVFWFAWYAFHPDTAVIS